jgi:hypothetical protein
VQRIGDVVQRLRRIAKAVQQQNRAVASRVAADRPRAVDDAVRPEREPRRDIVGKRTRRAAAPPDGGRQRRRDRDQ